MEWTKYYITFLCSVVCAYSIFNLSDTTDPGRNVKIYKKIAQSLDVKRVTEVKAILGILIRKAKSAAIRTVSNTHCSLPPTLMSASRIAVV